MLILLLLYVFCHVFLSVDAGQKLAEKLEPYRGANPFVLAIPHGGLPVAIEVTKGLGAGLDVIVVRKIPIPSNTEAV